MAENVLYSVRSLLGKEFLCPNLSFIPKTNVIFAAMQFASLSLICIKQM